MFDVTQIEVDLMGCLMSTTEHEFEHSAKYNKIRINCAVFEYYGSLKRLHSFVRENLTEPLPISRAASIMGMTPTSFSRFFRKSTGTTFKLWLDSQRVDRAEVLLQCSDSPILDVGIDSGFPDPTTFARTFHRIKGETPKEYRKRFRSSFLSEG